MGVGFIASDSDSDSGAWALRFFAAGADFLGAEAVARARLAGAFGFGGALTGLSACCERVLRAGAEVLALLHLLAALVLGPAADD